MRPYRYFLLLLFFRCCSFISCGSARAQRFCAIAGAHKFFVLSFRSLFSTLMWCKWFLSISSYRLHRFESWLWVFEFCMIICNAVALHRFFLVLCALLLLLLFAGNTTGKWPFNTIEIVAKFCILFIFLSNRIFFRLKMVDIFNFIEMDSGEFFFFVREMKSHAMLFWIEAKHCNLVVVNSLISGWFVRDILRHVHLVFFFHRAVFNMLVELVLEMRARRKKNNKNYCQPREKKYQQTKQTIAHYKEISCCEIIN